MAGLLGSVLLFSQEYTEINISDLPKKVHAYVDEIMPGASISKAAKSLDNQQVIYGTVIRFRDGKYCMLFDKDGNFLRKVENLSAASFTSAVPPATASSATAEPPPPPGTVAMKTIPESSLPEGVRKVIRETYKSYTILEAKEVPIGQAPIYQVILRDSASDHVYLFSRKGEILSRRSYELNNSPFLGQFPKAEAR